MPLRDDVVVTRVYVDMVGDLFHYGHVEFLRRARDMGDELVVGVLSDKSVEEYKRTPIMTMKERVAVVSGCRYVDRVLADVPLVPDRAWLESQGIDLVVHGDDFDMAYAARFYGAAMEMGIFRTIPYTVGISTTDLISRMQRQANDEDESS